MLITDTQEFSQPPSAIYRAFTDPAFIREKMEALGARHIEIQVEHKADEIHVRIEREVPIEVPLRLSRFMQAWNKVVQVEVWQGIAGGPYYGTIDLDFPNAPVRVNGHMTIASTPGGSTAVSETHIHSSVPFFGKLVSQLLSELSQKALQTEMDYIRRNA